MVWRVRSDGAGVQLVATSDAPPSDATALRLTVRVREVADGGLAWPAEAEWLTDRMDDALAWAMERLGAEWLATVWADGSCWMLVGVPQAAGQGSLAAAVTRWFPAHEVRVSVEPDPQDLWADLAPTAVECESLARSGEVVERGWAGDDLTAVRDVTYTVAVAESADRQALVTWAKAVGFRPDDLDEGDAARPYAVDLVRREALTAVPSSCAALLEGPGDPAVLDWGAPWHWRRRQPVPDDVLPLDDAMLAGFDGVAHEAWFPRRDVRDAFVEHLEAVGFAHRLLADTEVDVGLGCGVVVHRVEEATRARAVADDVGDLARAFGGRVTEVGPAGIQRRTARDFDAVALPTDEEAGHEAPSIDRFRSSSEAPSGSSMGLTALASLAVPGLGQALQGRSPAPWLLLASAVPLLAWLAWFGWGTTAGVGLWALVAGASAGHAAWGARRPLTLADGAGRLGVRGILVVVCVGPVLGYQLGRSLQREVEVASEEMAPELRPGDWVAVVPRELQAELTRGGLVVYAERDRLAVSRLVGLPGDRVGLDARGGLVHNGRALGRVLQEGSVIGWGVPSGTVRATTEELGDAVWFAFTRAEQLAPHEVLVGDDEVALAMNLRDSAQPFVVPLHDVIGPVHSVAPK